MKAVFIVLSNTDYLNELLETLIALNIKGATIIDSQGMVTKLAQEKEFASKIGFNAFTRFLALDKNPYSKTIFSVVKEEKVSELADAVKKLALCADSSSPFGFMFTLPVDDIFLLSN